MSCNDIQTSINDVKTSNYKVYNVEYAKNYILTSNNEVKIPQQQRFNIE